MTRLMMAESTKLQLAGLSTLAKAEFLGWARNRVAILSGNAQLIVNDERTHPISREKAKKIDREARELLDELMKMFPADPETASVPQLKDEAFNWAPSED